MWLPESIYRALPVAYALAGALFIMGALYLDMSEPMGPVYFALGLVCLLASITVTSWRYSNRHSRQKIDKDESPTA
jgi:hypothetical protein